MNTNEVILLKYGEIVLKGLNRNYFNQLLEKNVRRALKRAPGEYELVYAQSILFVRGKEGCDMDVAAELLKKELQHKDELLALHNYYKSVISGMSK